MNDNGMCKTQRIVTLDNIMSHRMKSCNITLYLLVMFTKHYCQNLKQNYLIRRTYASYEILQYCIHIL